MNEETKKMLVKRLETYQTTRLAWMITFGGLIGDEWKTLYSVYMKRSDRIPMSENRRRHNRFRCNKRSVGIPEDVKPDDIEALNIFQLRRLTGKTISKQYDPVLVAMAKEEIDRRNNILAVTFRSIEPKS